MKGEGGKGSGLPSAAQSGGGVAAGATGKRGKRDAGFTIQNQARGAPLTGNNTRWGLRCQQRPAAQRTLCRTVRRRSQQLGQRRSSTGQCALGCTRQLGLQPEWLVAAAAAAAAAVRAASRSVDPQSRRQLHVAAAGQAGAHTQRCLAALLLQEELARLVVGSGGSGGAARVLGGRDEHGQVVGICRRGAGRCTG